MRLLEGIVELLAPTRCAGCELPGMLLCDKCRAALPAVVADTACPRCAAPFGFMVCTECWSTAFAFEAALSLGELDGPLARALVLHKDAGERRLGGLLGEMMARLVAAEWAGWPDAICWVPATSAALSRRGFDHSFALAEPLARRLDVPLRPLLVRSRARDQRRLGRVDRMTSAHGTFKAAPQAPARVLVVDDVFTTGATLDAAAQALLAAGAREVRVAVAARSW